MKSLPSRSPISPSSRRTGRLCRATWTQLFIIVVSKEVTSNQPVMQATTDMMSAGYACCVAIVQVLQPYVTMLVCGLRYELRDLLHAFLRMQQPGARDRERIRPCHARASTGGNGLRRVQVPTNSALARRFLWPPPVRTTLVPGDTLQALPRWGQCSRAPGASEPQTAIGPP